MGVNIIYFTFVHTFAGAASPNFTSSWWTLTPWDVYTKDEWKSLMGASCLWWEPRASVPHWWALRATHNGYDAVTLGFCSGAHQQHVLCFSFCQSHPAAAPVAASLCRPRKPTVLLKPASWFLLTDSASCITAALCCSLTPFLKNKTAQLRWVKMNSKIRSVVCHQGQHLGELRTQSWLTSVCVLLL